MCQQQAIQRFQEQDCCCATLLYRILSHRKILVLSGNMCLQKKLPRGCAMNVVVKKLKQGKDDHDTYMWYSQSLMHRKWGEPKSHWERLNSCKFMWVTIGSLPWNCRPWTWFHGGSAIRTLPKRNNVHVYRGTFSSVLQNLAEIVNYWQIPFS